MEVEVGVTPTTRESYTAKALPTDAHVTCRNGIVEAVYSACKMKCIVL